METHKLTLLGYIKKRYGASSVDDTISAVRSLNRYDMLILSGSGRIIGYKHDTNRCLVPVSGDDVVKDIAMRLAYIESVDKSYSIRGYTFKENVSTFAVNISRFISQPYKLPITLLIFLIVIIANAYTLAMGFFSGDEDRWVPLMVSSFCSIFAVMPLFVSFVYEMDDFSVENKATLLDYCHIKNVKGRANYMFIPAVHRYVISESYHLIRDSESEEDRELAIRLYDELISIIDSSYTVVGDNPGEMTTRQISNVLNDRFSKSKKEINELRKSLQSVKENMDRESDELNANIIRTMFG